jgi:phosphopantetheinyl transferase
MLSFNALPREAQIEADKRSTKLRSQETRSDGESITDLFAASARNCTPAAARDAACVLFAPVSHDHETSSRCASVLSDAELRKADSFLTQDLKNHFKQRRAFRRYCGALALGSALPLSKVVFETTEKGRPYLPELPGCWLSFSSCRLGYLGAWSSMHCVGVDIEDQLRSLEAPVVELARWYFSKAEAIAIEGMGDPARMDAFLKLWTLKEAALKSVGEGLPFGLDAFAFELTPTLRVIHAPLGYCQVERLHSYVIDGTGGCAALVVRSLG